MNKLFELVSTLSFIDYVLAGAIVLYGFAFLMHIWKEPKDAHGKNRK